MSANANPCPPPPPLQTVPKDGWGPRGVPECYYTSRVLDSTAGYVRFVKKLRIMEEEIRVGTEIKKKQCKDQEILDFFAKTDRKSVLKEMENRVNICLEQYNDEVKEKRKRLIQLLNEEEERDIAKFVDQAQQGTQAIFEEKMQRLELLLAKRKKEHENKLKAIPLSKCAHVSTCLFKMRAKEAEECQLYQMREKQSRKLAEAEFDRMWQELAMKESDALAARMEVDEIEKLRRIYEGKQSTEMQLEERRQQHLRDQEKLKQDALEMKAQLAELDRLDEEKQRQNKEKLEAKLIARDEELRDRKETVAKALAEEKMIDETWDFVARQSMSENVAKEQRKRQILRDIDECNRKMVDMKHRIAQVKYNSDPMILAEGQRLQDAVDLKRCQTRKENKRQKLINQQAILKQIKDKEEDVIEGEKVKAREEYDNIVRGQLDELVKHKQLTDAQARKLYQKDLLDQIDYNKLLKDRALQEELDQRKKYQIAKDDYQKSIEEMMSRQFFCDVPHPFMKVMADGVKMRWCPCAADLCAHEPEASQ